MATADGGVTGLARAHPRMVTTLLTVAGYGLVIGTLYLGLPIYPRISQATVSLLSHAIAVINALTVTVLGAGWYFIRTGRVRRHRAAMITAFTLIVLFLVLYLLKTGGGGRKDVIGGAHLLRMIYLGTLGIHIVLSIIAVPVVLYALTLGLTHTPTELRRQTPHRRVGRIAASAWIVSLVLGIAAYVLLNYLLEYEFVRLVAGPI